MPERRKFSEDFAEILDFRKDQGRIPTYDKSGTDRDKENLLGSRIGEWRRQHKKGRLKKHYADRLEGVGISLDTQRDKEDERHDLTVACVRFFEKTGRWPRVESDDPSERKLAGHLNRCRTLHKKEKLDDSIESRLEYAGFIMDTKAEGEERFKRNLEAIVAFREENGRLPSQHSKDRKEKKLGALLRNWRDGYRNELLREDGKKPTTRQRLPLSRAKMIIEAGIVLDMENFRELEFDSLVDKICKFRDQKGHLPRRHVEDEVEKRLADKINQWKTAYESAALLIRGKIPERAERMSDRQMKILVDRGIIEDKLGVLQMSNGDRKLRGSNEVYCFKQGDRTTVAICGHAYMESTTFNKSGDECYHCLQGRLLRETDSEDKILSLRERLELGVIDK